MPRIDNLRSVYAQACQVDDTTSWWTPRSKLRARRMRRESRLQLIEALSLPYDATEEQVKAMGPQPQPQPSITCPKCGRTSYNPGDIEHQYCGACHQFHGEFV